MNDQMYIVIELQTNGDKNTHLIDKYTDNAKAVQKYFQILAAAAVSKVECHTAVILTETGRVVRSETFNHEQEVSEND